jgi:hypothetical protein
MRRVFTIGGTVLLLQFLSGDSFNGQDCGMVSTEDKGARCYSKLHMNTSVVNAILDEARTGKIREYVLQKKEIAKPAVQASTLALSANENGLKL